MNDHPKNRRPSALRTTAAYMLAGTGLAAGSASGATCESLAGVAIPFTTITIAQTITGGTFTPPTGAVITGLPDFCRVALVMAPSADSSIRVEIWMPLTGWGGRYEGLGGGGYTGSINYTSLATALRASFAAAQTDMGTAPATGGNGSAIVGHPEKFLDFGSRSTHEMTVAAKTLIEVFYGQPAAYSYFVGCSTGGHQGLEEAQVFPDDYDGILAGAPGHNRTHLHTAFVWDYAVPRKAGASLISAAKLSSLNNAVLAACVGRDGGLATEGYLTDPRDCMFDPASLLCSGTDAPTCLTTSEVQTARLFYDGPRNPRTGKRIYPGWALGSELGWTALQGTTQPDFEGIYKWALGANYDPLAVDFDADMAKVDAVLAPSVNFMNSDLSRFASTGGKLLLYHGFADPIVVSQDTINYFQRIMSEQHLTLAQAQEFVRLFMVPGMGHCSGGAGPNVFDALTALMQWVENGVEPTRIVATKFVNNNANLGVQMTRPLCPYPQEPRYAGSGDTNSAGNFSCTADLNDEPPSELPARDYLAPFIMQAKPFSPTLDLRSSGGLFYIALSVPPGSDTFSEWTLSNVRAEGTLQQGPGVIFGDGHTYLVAFNKNDLATFMGGSPAGEPVDLMLTGTLQHNGNTSLFAVSATVKVLR